MLEWMTLYVCINMVKSCYIFTVFGLKSFHKFMELCTRESHTVGLNFLPITTMVDNFLYAASLFHPLSFFRYLDNFLYAASSLFNNTPYLDQVCPMYFSTCVSAYIYGLANTFLCAYYWTSAVTVTVSIGINNLVGMLISGRTLDVTGCFQLIGIVPAFSRSVYS
jgi:hypothetical protein